MAHSTLRRKRAWPPEAPCDLTFDYVYSGQCKAPKLLRRRSECAGDEPDVPCGPGDLALLYKWESWMLDKLLDPARPGAAGRRPKMDLSSRNRGHWKRLEYSFSCCVSSSSPFPLYFCLSLGFLPLFFFGASACPASRRSQIGNFRTILDAGTVCARTWDAEFACTPTIPALARPSWLGIALPARHSAVASHRLIP